MVDWDSGYKLSSLFLGFMVIGSGNVVVMGIIEVSTVTMAVVRVQEQWWRGVGVSEKEKDKFDFSSVSQHLQA
jgi:hypothetical protein